MKCDICGEELGDEYFVYENLEKGIIMFVCMNCIEKKEKVIEVWEKTKLKNAT